MCKNDAVIPLYQFCDGIQQCQDGSDEDCGNHSYFYINFINNCRPYCGIKYIIMLMLSSLEISRDICKKLGLSDCGNGLCYPKYLECDGINQCPGGQDEQNCGSASNKSMCKARNIHFYCI